jgi:uncharacterized protein (DUF58 family)
MIAFLRNGWRQFRRREPLWIPLRGGAFRITARHGVLIVIWILIGVLAYQTGHDLFYRLFYLIFAIELLSFSWSAYNISTFRLERQLMTPRAHVGKVAEERFLIHNTGRLNKIWVEIRDESELPAHRASRVINALRAGVRWSWNVRTVCRRRGRFRIGPVTVAMGDPFGLFVFHRRMPDTTFAITVYPAAVDLPTFVPSLGQMPGGEAVQRRTHHITTNVAGTREYVPGDSFNRIHWRSTARMDRLIVKEFELDPSADVWLYLDLEREAQANAWYEEAWLARDLSALWMSRRDQVMRLPPSTEEYGVTIAASLAKFYLRQQRAVGFAAYGHEREIVQPDRGERQLNRLLQVLAVLRAEGRMQFSRVLAQEATRLGRNHTLVVITPSSEIAWLKSIQEIKRRGLRVIAVLVDAKSFGGYGDAASAATELLASGIPALVVREGDDLRAALSR